jgi:hypothetical protein
VVGKMTEKYTVARYFVLKIYPLHDEQLIVSELSAAPPRAAARRYRIQPVPIAVRLGVYRCRGCLAKVAIRVGQGFNWSGKSNTEGRGWGVTNFRVGGASLVRKAHIYRPIGLKNVAGPIRIGC